MPLPTSRMDDSKFQMIGDSIAPGEPLNRVEAVERALEHLENFMVREETWTYAQMLDGLAPSYTPKELVEWCREQLRAAERYRAEVESLRGSM